MAMEEHAMEENAMAGKPFESPSGQQRIVNVHQAKTHLSRLIDAAHGGETILLAKAGKPWARPMPLKSEAPRRVAGRLRHLGPLSDPEALLEPITAVELAQWEAAPLLPVGSPLVEAE
jgi:antitoxin (DNA-binding transcriptional repressor) of toxin-antitoxin stability system